MTLVEIRKKGQRTRGETLQEHQRRFELNTQMATAAQRQTLRQEAQQYFKPIVAEQPTRRLFHDTRVGPAAGNRGTHGKYNK
jgi:hypothetical protein